MWYFELKKKHELVATTKWGAETEVKGKRSGKPAPPVRSSLPQELVLKITKVINVIWISNSVHLHALLYHFQVAVTTFAVYVLTGHNLTASKAFVALSLFGIMRFPLGFFPDVIASCIQVSAEKTSGTLNYVHARVLQPGWGYWYSCSQCLSYSTFLFTAK